MHVDLINVGYLTHVSSSGYNDVAIFKEVAINSELTQTSYVIIVSLKSEPMVKLIKRIQGERQSFCGSL